MPLLLHPNVLSRVWVAAIVHSFIGRVRPSSYLIFRAIRRGRVSGVSPSNSLEGAGNLNLPFALSFFSVDMTSDAQALARVLA